MHARRIAPALFASSAGWNGDVADGYMRLSMSPTPALATLRGFAPSTTRW